MFKNELLISHLIELRTSNNLTQSELGSVLGVKKQGINEIEKGRVKISVDKLAILADYFNVSTDYLLGRTANPKVNK